MTSGVPHRLQRGKQERGNGPSGQIQLCIYSAGISKWSRTHPPLPLPLLPPRSLVPSRPPSVCWPAPHHASRGRFLPQLGVLGCVAACLYWSVDFLVAACTYLNIPPAAALCSRPRTASTPPPSPAAAPASSSITRFILTRRSLLALTPSSVLSLSSLLGFVIIHTHCLLSVESFCLL